MLNTLKVKHTVLIGSGALENCWLPVFSAIYRFSGHKTNSPETANVIMARLVFEPRYHRDYLQRCRTKEKQKQERHLSNSLQKLKEFKRILAEELVSSSKKNEITLRNAQAELIKQYIDINHTMIVTTNWSVNELQGLGPKIFLPLHGSLHDEGSIYLPAETSVDFSFTHDEYLKSGAIHFESIKAINCSSLIVFWGLGLNALDIEVTAMLSEAFSLKNKKGKNYKIIIFDKNPSDVAERLIFLGVVNNYIKQIKIEL